MLAAAASPEIAYQIGQHFKTTGGQGSAEHLLAHAILGAAVAAAGGNNPLTAAASAASAEAAAPTISQWLYGNADPATLTAEQKQTITTITSLLGTGMGAAGGNTATAASGNQSAATAVQNNRQLHPDELAWIKNNAPAFARFLKNGEEPTQQEISDAERRLHTRAADSLDLLWLIAHANYQDDAAAQFLQSANGSFTNELGQQQPYFTVQGKDFTRPELYATESYLNLNTIIRNLHAPSNRSITDGAIEISDHLTQEYWQKIKDDPILAFLQAAATPVHMAGQTLQSSWDCATHLADCGTQFINSGRELGTSLGTGIASFQSGDLTALYGQDVSDAQAILIGLRSTEALLTATGAGRIIGKFAPDIAPRKASPPLRSRQEGQIGLKDNNIAVVTVPSITVSRNIRRGESEGGPGRWMNSEDGIYTPEKGAAYQQFVTGAPRHTEYVVTLPDGTRKKFDGYEPPTNSLVDAKDYNNWPIPTLAFSVDRVVEDARESIKVAKQVNANLIWYVPNKKAKEILEGIFIKNNLEGISVIVKEKP